MTHFSGLSERYHLLGTRALDVLRDESSVGAVLIGGSVGRGEADASSDLDLIAVTRTTADAELFASAWPGWLGRITDTVYRRLLHGRVVTAVSPTWERLDVSVVEVDAVSVMPWGPVTVVFDDIGIDLPSPPIAAPLDGARLVAMTEDFLRSVGLMVTDLDRGEFTVLTWASEFMLQELVDLMFIEAGRVRRTMKRVCCDLAPADVRTLDGIARARPDRESIIASELAIAAEFLPRARRLIERAGARWPSELEASTNAYLEATIGRSLPPSR